MENFEDFNNYPGGAFQQQNSNYQNVQKISETASVSVPEDLANFKNFLERAEDGNRLSNMFWGHNIFDQNQFPPRTQIINSNNFGGAGGGFVVPPLEERRPTILQDGGLTYASLVPKNGPKGSVEPIKQPSPIPFMPTNYPNNVGLTYLSYYGQNIPSIHNNFVGNYPNNPYYYPYTTGSTENNGGIPFPLLTPPPEENIAQGPSGAHISTGGPSAQLGQVPNFAHQPNQQTHTYVRADTTFTNNIEEWQTTTPLPLPSGNYTQTGSVNRKSTFFNFSEKSSDHMFAFCGKLF